MIYSLAKTLTPTIYLKLQESIDWMGKTPRPFTTMLQTTFGDEPILGVEIGFGLGFNAVSLLECLNIKKLYCIDPYIGKPYQEFYGTVDFTRYVSRYSDLEARANVKFVKLMSDDAHKVIPNDLDFVYVDGLHKYEQCLKDLENYWQSIKQGGFIGGHDFAPGCDNEVVKAVLEFGVSINQVPKIVMPDYWFQKNGDEVIEK